MGYSFFIYAPVTFSTAQRAVAAMYETLEQAVESLPKEQLEDEDGPVGEWPEIEASSSSTIPSSGSFGSHPDTRVEEAALERLARCTSVIRIDRPADWDPLLVTAVRTLAGNLGPFVFAGGHSLDLVTSESLIAEIASHPDVATALRELDLDDEIEADEGDEPATDSARPEVLRAVLAEIAQQPRVRRRVGERLEAAPRAVQMFAERLARVGPEPDTTVAKALSLTEEEVAEARRVLADLFRRAEGR